jgi:hypothetical protein
MSNSKMNRFKLLIASIGAASIGGAVLLSFAHTRDAEYEVALAKCDTMSGTQKDTCGTSAKSAFGK